MSNSAINPQMIKFSIVLTGLQLSQPDKETLENLAKKYIHTLIEDLSIPAKSTLSLRFSDSKNGVAPSPLKISIDNKECRNPFSRKPLMR